MHSQCRANAEQTHGPNAWARGTRRASRARRGAAKGPLSRKADRLIGPIEIGQSNLAVGTAAADQTWRREGETRSLVEHGGCYRPLFEEYHTHVGSVAALLELLTLGPQN